MRSKTEIRSIDIDIQHTGCFFKEVNIESHLFDSFEFFLSTDDKQAHFTNYDTQVTKVSCLNFRIKNITKH